MIEFPGNIISENILFAFGITIMHSLWIGAAISGIAALLCRFFHKSSDARYIVAVTGLTIIFISSIIIFINSASGENQIYETKEPYLHEAFDQSEAYATDNSLAVITDASPALAPMVKLAEKIFIYHSDLLLLLWLAGTIIMTLRFTGSYIYAYRFRNHKTNIVNSYWTDKAAQIAESINLKRKFKVVKSSFAKSPLVSGWLKPAIIFPYSLLTGLPADQIEAIIAHELAHIKRNDYLVNILQSIIEIILFYNPAVWWLSDRIRTERENCCDDMVLASGNETLVYAKALLGIQEITSGNSLLMALNGNHKTLNRIKRLTEMKNNRNDLKERLIAVLSVIIIFMSLSFSIGFASCATASGKGPAGNDIIATGYSTDLSKQDTVRDKSSATINSTWTDPSDNKEKRVKMLIEHGEVTELYIDNERIPDSQFDKYRDLIDDTLVEYEEAMKELAEIDLEEIEDEIEEAMKEIEEIDIEKMEFEIQEALSGIEKIDMQEMQFEIQEALSEIEKIDMEEMQFEIQEALSEIEKIDMEEMEMEIRESIREIEKIDIEELEFEIQEALREIEKIDMKELETEIRKAREYIKEKEKLKKNSQKK